MRIGLFTDTYYPEVNGVANSVFQLKTELENRGNQVYVFTVENPLVKENEEHVYRMKSIECPLLKERRMSYATFYRWFDVIKSLNLDIIHTNTEFMVGHIGRRAARKLQIPLVHTYHTIYEDYTHYLKVPGNSRLKGIIRGISCICCDHADRVIAPTDKVKNLLLSYGVKKQITVQPTGIIIYKFNNVSEGEVNRIKETYNIKADVHVLISIGRLSEEKNLGEIVDFMNELVLRDNNAKLLIVGDGPEKSKLESKVESNNLTEHVYFTGEVDWKEIQNYYSAGDVFVSASTSETQGLTYAEALACGKPLLVRHDECLDNLLLEGKNGYSYQNEDEFFASYTKLFENNLYKEMEPDVRQSVKKLSAEAFGANIEEIYRQLCKENESLRLCERQGENQNRIKDLIIN